MANDVLKSFLMELGFKIDAGAERRFMQTVGNATKAAAALSLGIEGAAIAVGRYVDRIARNFDQLYFSSQRIGATATNIKALTYGLSQSGSSAEAARASLESFGRTLRTQPGHYQVLERLGVRTRDMAGNLRDSTALMQDFGKALRSMPDARRYQYFDLFGIDENSGRALVQGVDKFTKEYREKLKASGLDPDQAARDGAALQRVLTNLGESVGIIGDKIGSALFKDQGANLQHFIDFLDKNGDAVAKTVSEIAGALLRLAEALLKLATSKDAQAFLEDVGRKFETLVTKTDEWGKSIGGLEKVLMGFATFLAVQWVGRILGAFGLVKGGWAGLLGALGLANPVALGALATAGAAGAAGAMQAPMVDDFGNVVGNWGGKDESKNPAASAGFGGKGALAPYRRGFLGRLKDRVTGPRSSLRKGQYGSGANYSGANADVLRQAAKDLGTTPEALATVISYETGGTFSPSIRGGTGNDHIGLIQFGSNEQHKYGASQGQTFAQQMGSVVGYLKDRGFKPGMGIADLYSTINAGKPGLYGKNDGNGTVSQHVQRMLTQHQGNVQRFLGGGGGSDGIAGDLSGMASYSNGQMDGVKEFIVHHTGGGGTPEGVINTLNQRKLGVQYVMGRDGKIYRALPEGARGAHIRPSQINDLSNANSLGMEVIAKDDNDVTPEQIRSGKAFLEMMQKKYPGLEIFGHGEVNPGHKQADEGLSIARAARGRDPKLDPNYKPADIPIQERTLQNYMGRDPVRKLNEHLGFVDQMDRARLASLTDARSQTAVHMPVTNHLTLNAGNDPQDQARTIGRGLKRVHDDLYRNMVTRIA